MVKAFSSVIISRLAVDLPYGRDAPFYDKSDMIGLQKAVLILAISATVKENLISYFYISIYNKN